MINRSKKKLEKEVKKENYFKKSLKIFLRKKYPKKTAINVSFDCGISDSTIKGWIVRRWIPSSVALLTLIEVYGPELLVEIMINPPRWLLEAVEKENNNGPVP